MADDEDCAICHLKMILPTAVNGCGHSFCFLCIKGVAFTSIGGNDLCPMCRGPLDREQFKRPVAQHDESLDMRDPEDSMTQAPLPSTSPPIDVPDTQIKKEIKEEPVSDDDEPGTSAGAKRKAFLVPASVLKKPRIEEAPKPKPKVFWLYKGGGNSWWRYDPRTEKDIEQAHAAGSNTTDILTCGVTYVIDFSQLVQYRRDNANVKREIQRVEGKENLERMHVKGIAGVRLPAKQH